MAQEYRRQLNNKTHLDDSLSNNQYYDDNPDLIKKKQSKIKQFSKQLYLLFQQFINLLNQLNFEYIMLGFMKLFLILPLIQTAFIVHIIIIQNHILLQILIVFSLVCRIILKYTIHSFFHLYNENNFIKHALIILDLENVYLMIKSPSYLDDLFNDRIEIQSHYYNQAIFTSNQFVLFAYYMKQSECFGQYFTYLQMLVTSVYSAVLIKNYLQFYPNSNNKPLQSWLSNKHFAISFLHGYTFYSLLLQNSLSFGYVIYLQVVLQIIQTLPQSNEINIYRLFAHIVIDFPFTKENITKQVLLNYGYKQFTNGILVCIIQKIILIILTIIAMSYQQYYISYSQFIFSSSLIVLSIVSLSKLIQRYIYQKQLLSSQQPQLIEVNSKKELQQIINLDQIKNSHKFGNLQVINVIEENINIKDIIQILFYCYEKSDIYFKNKKYCRFTTSKKSLKAVIINNILDLHNLDFSENKQIIQNHILAVIVQEKQQFQNEDIYQKLIQNNIIVIIINDSEQCPSYLTYQQYTNIVRKVKLQIIAYNTLISEFILNNPSQVYFDLYV